MKNSFLFLAAVVILFTGCSGNSLKGRYVDVWDFHQEKDAVSVYEFSRNGEVVQSLEIKPFDELNFKGVDDVVNGEYKIKDDTFGIPKADGTVWERKFIKE